MGDKHVVLCDVMHIGLFTPDPWQRCCWNNDPVDKFLRQEKGGRAQVGLSTYSPDLSTGDSFVSTLMNKKWC